MVGRALLPSVDKVVSVLERLERMPRLALVSLIVASTAAVLALDAVSGPHLSLVLLYVAIVGVAAAVLGIETTLGVVLLVSGAGLAVAVGDGEVPFWVAVFNAVFRTIFLAGVASVVILGRTTLRELDRRSITDPLTGSLNRRGLFGAATAAAELARRDATPLAVLYLDVDELKSVNDAISHEAGDRLIRQFSDALIDTTRAVDSVGRLGGDEFCVLLHATTASGAETVVARIRLACRDHDPPISFSCGAVVWTDPPVDPGALIKPADDLMYRAKGLGGGTHIIEMCSGSSTVGEPQSGGGDHGGEDGER